MRFFPKLAIVMQLTAAIWLAFLPQFALAYDHPLSDEALTSYQHP